MKITSFVKEKMTPKRFVMRTEPPVTPALMAKFQEITGTNYAHWDISADKDGLLFINPPVMPHHVKALEEALTLAESHVKDQKERQEKEREEFLKAVSDQAGLPVE